MTSVYRCGDLGSTLVATEGIIADSAELDSLTLNGQDGMRVHLVADDRASHSESAWNELQDSLPNVLVGKRGKRGKRFTVSVFSLVQELAQLNQRLTDVLDLLHYAPGGPVFQAAQSDFHQRLEDISK
eukprot:gnl/Hemi2/27799_TR9186_c0_g2_i1.p1 gnl/Hemi2/27799_TR9186_c0_g2~~gnl/Hemi2/27799_TR9186_c0_g2_i1.p1  ORF type:complete len:138 (+),score=17.96 gnl/Hemi2/27799_TR9186_c0_g2_i1:33-416(+)